jgi:copper chaperone CopZ
MLAESVFACGYCIEDKIAATYDHAVIVGAADRRHQVVFLSLGDGPTKGRERAVVRAVESAPGVDAGTVRVSLENGAISFAFDPSRTSLNSIVGSVRRKLAGKGSGVSVLRVL